MNIRLFYDQTRNILVLALHYFQFQNVQNMFVEGTQPEFIDMEEKSAAEFIDKRNLEVAEFIVDAKSQKVLQYQLENVEEINFIK